MKRFGLIGEKLSHSLSPQIHEYIFDALGLRGSYELFPVPKDKIPYVGHGMKLFNIQGLNVTIPYKEDIITQLDQLSEEAKTIGAVNTIALKEGRLLGYNTDYFGFGKMLDINGVSVLGKKAAVLGSGGSSKAVCAYLLDQGAQHIFLITRQKETKHSNHPQITYLDYHDLKGLTGDLLINTTPVGMYPHVGYSPVPSPIIQNFDTLVDLIYNPIQSEFLKLGKGLGKKTIDGLYMLVAQAVKAQEIWQGQPISDGVVQRVYDALKG